MKKLPAASGGTPLMRRMYNGGGSHSGYTPNPAPGVAEKRGALVSRVDAVVKERARALYHLDVTDVQLTKLDTLP